MAWGRKEQPQNQDFSSDTKARAKDKRRKEDKIPDNIPLEVDHIVPKYLGGTADEDNAQALSKNEHGFKHFLGAFFGEPEQHSEAEWMGTRQIISRMDKDDFAKFLAKAEPLVPDLKERLFDKNPKKRK